MTDALFRDIDGARPYVVILYGGPASGWCSLNRCPMDVHGPFPSRERAAEYVATLPAGFEPHVMTLAAPLP